MLSNKPSKKSNKAAALSAAPVSEQIVSDSKPAKRTPPSSAVKSSEPAPKQVSHRHSRVTLPATPVVEGVITEVVVAASAPIDNEEVARLAYTFWQERNYADGSADEDWHRAAKALAATN